MPPLTVGQHVAQGQQVGRIGRSGADEFHLHYTQLKDGKAVRVAFNGQEIATHAGDESSWNKWSTRTGEELTSYNCPANGLAPFVQDGKNHILSYQSRTGNGNGLTTLVSGTWGKTWSHFAPFTLGGEPYFVAYDQLAGSANIDRIKADGKGSVTVESTTWTKGWTSVEAFALNGHRYLALYRGSSGCLKIVELTGGATDVDVTTVATTTIPAGQSHVLPLVQNGAATLLSYDPLTGMARFQKLSPGAVPYPDAVGTTQWTKGWTAFTPFVVDSRPHVLLHKGTSGEVGVVKLDAGFTSATKIASQSWSAGLS